MTKPSISLMDLVVDLAASRRITRLITKDEITEPVRAHSFFHSHEKLSYLINCPICVGIYTSAGVVVSSIVFPRASKPIRYFLALAELQATLAEEETRRDASSQGF